MANPTTIKLTGGRQLQRQLSKLGPRIEKNAMRAGLRAGGQIIAKDAKQRVHADKAVLKKSIGVKQDTIKGKIITRIGPRRGKKQKYDGWYGHFEEFGTILHSPHPFMRPAFENNKEKALKAIFDKIHDYLLKLKDK